MLLKTQIIVYLEINNLLSANRLYKNNIINFHNPINSYQIMSYYQTKKPIIKLQHLYYVRS